MKIVIIGGVAAGASAAARLRRLDETCEIVLLEKGNAVSYANCGLPYHLGGVIPERENLLVMSKEKLASWLNIEVRLQTEVTAIDRAKKELTLQTASGGSTEHYDKLLLATGAMPNGSLHAEKVLPLWTIADMDRILTRIVGAHHVAVIGGGFIGLEAAENLRERGLQVTLIQRGNHVLPTLDQEMAGSLADELTDLGIALKLQTTVTGVEEKAERLFLHLSDNTVLETDFAIESTGVRPNSDLAKQAGLACGERGHILVDEFLRTSDPDIFAAGDAIEVRDPIFGGNCAIALAGPANKQGRIAAANLLGAALPYRGTLGTSVVKIGRLTAAAVGYTESRLRAMGKEYRKLYLHPFSHASYYPGAEKLTMKLLFGADGTIYGAQIVAAEGADKRIDTIASAMRCGLKAPELGTLELAYAPPYSAAKDPVNFAGFIAENLLTGLSDAVYPDTIPSDALILDVREPEEHELGAIPGAINIRLGELRGRLDELDRNRLIVCCCQVGLRGYLAERILKQHGFRAANLSGGWLTWKMFHHQMKQPLPPPEPSASVPAGSKDAAVLDLTGLACPGPILKLKAAAASVPQGSAIRLTASSGFESDLRNWAKSAHCQIARLTRDGGNLTAEVITPDEVATVPETPAALTGENKAAIVLFSNDLDKAMAAMILANGFAAAGAKVTIFFTFWGLSVLRKDPAPPQKKGLVARLFGRMLPTGAEKLALSKMNMLGMGSAMMKQVMRQQNVLPLPELIRLARSAGVRFVACDMAMGVMGITREELIDVDEVAGVATFAEAARDAATLFI